MKKILFTKALPLDTIISAIGLHEVVIQDFIDIEYIDLSHIKMQANFPTDYNLVSSSRATHRIKDLSLNAGFYCVGSKSEKVLLDTAHTVLHCAETAEDLLVEIQSQVKEESRFNFFCSSIRRDTLPDGLRKLGHKVNEIVCYHTHSKTVSIKNDFDGYVFFSPSGVKSFAQQYDIPKNASIFAIGKTTCDAVEEELAVTAEVPQNATVASLLELIKKRIDAEK